MAPGSSQETSYFSVEMAGEWLAVFTVSLLASHVPSGFDYGQVCLLSPGSTQHWQHGLVWVNSAACLGLALPTS